MPDPRALGVAALFALLLPLAGCPGTSLTTCDVQPDLTGEWSLTLSPLDGSPPTIPRGDTIVADLVQMPRPNSSLGALVWGTLTSNDAGFFDTVTIPQLVMNNGSKTGGVVGCALKINVPIASTVTDDNADNGPLRIGLAGTIVATGMMTGAQSTLIRADNPAMTAESFTWSAMQR